MTSDETQTSFESVSWIQSRGDLPPPIAQKLLYVELKLTHDTLEGNRVGSRFFPAAIPYQYEDENRVFFWRPFLADCYPARLSWDAVCATTHELRPIDNRSPVSPRLWTRRNDGIEVVVDGTVAGESTSMVLQAYQPPAITIESTTPAGIQLNVDGTSIRVQSGSQRSVPLSEQTVSDLGSRELSLEPKLQVRYPGQRTVYHPNSEMEEAVFPSFDLDIQEMPDQIRVPMANGELDHGSLAANFGVDLSNRPYAERVLWQAFAYQTFDPHRDSSPRLSQGQSGLIRLLNPCL